MLIPFPNATIDHKPDALELRQALALAGWTHAEAAMLAGVTTRTIERYLSPTAAARGYVMPYPLQFTLEAIARQPRTVKRHRERKTKPAPPAPPTTTPPPRGVSRLLG